MINNDLIKGCTAFR